MKSFSHNPKFNRLANFVLLINHFVVSLTQEMRLSTAAITTYRYHMFLFLAYLQNVLGLDIEPQHVDRKLLLEYLFWLKEVRNLSVSSVSGHGNAIKQFYIWAYRENHLRINPAENLPLPRPPRTLPRPFTIDEVARLLDSFQTLRPKELRDLAIVELMYGSGLRIGEALSIRTNDIVLDKENGINFVRILGKGSKFRIVPLSDPSVDALIALGVHAPGSRDEAYVFAGRGKSQLSQAIFTHRFKTYLKRANIDLTSNPHQLRHSFASHLLAGNADIRAIQELLGHERLSTTQIYSQVTPLQVFKAFRKVSPRERLPTTIDPATRFPQASEIQLRSQQVDDEPKHA